MAKFRKKPVVIEAHRIGDDRWPDSIWQGVIDDKIILHLSRDGRGNVIGHVMIDTLEGQMRGEVGDWIIRGVAGEFYPCKADIFYATYEHVSPFCVGPDNGLGGAHTFSVGPASLQTKWLTEPPRDASPHDRNV